MAHRSDVVRRSTLGVDLGTTHTVAAHGGEPLEVAPGEARPTLLPSVVAHPPSGDVLVGWPARRRRAIDPAHTLRSTKRLIGAPWPSSRATRFAERHPYAVVDAGGTAAVRTRAGTVTPVEVAAQLLLEACRASRREPSTHDAVISVPAAFEAAERAATLEAARLAGFASARLIDEPVATAVGYLTRSNLRYAVVYDLGGGTFDVAVVDCLRHPFRVAAHGGDPYLGGDDVDRALAQQVAARVLREHRWDLASDAETFARLVAACEGAKVALSDAERAIVDVAAVDEAAPFGALEVTVERAELEALTTDVVRRTFVLCDAVLGDAGLTTRDVDAVFLAGGSTSLPGLREMVGAYFGKRARFDLDPMHVVAHGASLAAARPNLAGLLDADGFGQTG